MYVLNLRAVGPAVGVFGNNNTHQSFLRFLLGLRGGLHGQVKPKSGPSALLWQLHICQEEKQCVTTTGQSDSIYLALKMRIALDFPECSLISCGMCTLQDWTSLQHHAYSSVRFLKKQADADMQHTLSRSPSHYPQLSSPTQTKGLW